MTPAFGRKRQMPGAKRQRPDSRRQTNGARNPAKAGNEKTDSIFGFQVFPVCLASGIWSLAFPAHRAGMIPIDERGAMPD
jgi:hypothetical protein